MRPFPPVALRAHSHFLGESFLNANAITTGIVFYKGFIKKDCWGERLPSATQIRTVRLKRLFFMSINNWPKYRGQFGTVLVF